MGEGEGQENQNTEEQLRGKDKNHRINMGGANHAEKEKTQEGGFRRATEGEVSMALRKLRAAAGPPGPGWISTGWKFAKNSFA